MAQRGRKSAAGLLTVVKFVEPLPEPPIDLTEAEAAIFRDVTAAMPAGWFRADSLPLLTEYARAVNACNQLAELRHSGQFTSIKDIRDLLNTHEKQARLVVTLATKMRLTMQSRVLKDQAGRDAQSKPVLAPPWHGASATLNGSKNTAGSRTGS